MFESLQEGLHSALRSLRGKGKLTESNMREGLNLVEQSLLEADVSYPAIQHFMGKVSEKALGEKVLKSLKPGDHLIGFIYEELVQLLGPVDSSLHLKQDVNVLMLCGLQGSGKTTTCGKLAKLLQENKARPLLAAADLQRPAAIDQLHVLGEQLGVSVYSERGSKDPVKVCQNAVKQARQEDANVVILDTAGRLAIDEELMNELRRIDNKVAPHQVYLVVDGMTGQDAVNSAKAFNDALELDGVIMTKLDGDTRGGALLSVKFVAETRIKFIGVGEHLDALEPFRPEGMANRILGMGDVLALVDEAKKLVDDEERAKIEEKMQKGQFTLGDFKEQMIKLAQPGLMQKMLGLMPGMGELKEMMDSADSQGDLKRTIGIIDSMTPAERREPSLIDPSRRQRIASGSGVQPQEVNALIKQYDMMRPIMMDMAGTNMRDRMKKIQELQGAMMNPGGGLPRTKKSTGKRISSAEKKNNRKQREKMLRKMRKEKRRK